MGGRTIAGHHRFVLALSPPPGPRQSPAAGWRMSCRCGWAQEPFARRSDGENAYSEHLAGAQRICTTCNTPKAERFMSKASPHRCKACARAALKAWVAANPSEYERARRKSHLKKHYGITAEQFDAMLAAQGGQCAICSEPPTDARGFRPHVDHCHASGKIRGILCGRCNKALGQFKDDASLLRRAIAYLES